MENENDKDKLASQFANKPHEIFYKEFAVETQAYVWCAIHAHLQLALRHPELNVLAGASSKFVQKFADALLDKLRDMGTYTQEEYDFVKAEQKKFLDQQQQVGQQPT